MPSGFVYILTNKRNGTLYIGIRHDLHARMEQHRLGKGSKFVARYGLNHLVWFEEYPLYTTAIQRETSLKRWSENGN
jgi:putative endonuclease